MSFLNDKCTFSEMTPDIIAAHPAFVCGRDKDIDEFFHSEYADYKKQLLGKSYCFIEDDEPQRIVCAFTISNSSVRVDNLPNKKRNKLNRKIPQSKRRSQYPAVLVGQLAVFDDFQGLHLGNEVLDFIKSWFIDPLNKTGCRYIVVDAINNTKVIDFYKQAGFNMFFASDDEEIRYLSRSTNNRSLLAKLKSCFINNDQSIEEFRRTRLMYFDLILLNSAK